MESYFMLTLLMVLGLVIGSFVSVLTYRIPRHLGFVKGRSFCDSCKKELNWYDNIPLVSFLFYCGVSRCCGRKISIRYPLTELAFAVSFIVLYLFSLSPVYYVLCTVSLAILIIDFEHQIIPDELTWLVLFLGLLTINSSFLFVNLFSGFLFSLLLLALHLLTAGRGMGLGDVKLAIPFGWVLGLEKGIYWLMTSFVLGGITASVLLILRKANLKTKIAFGPFLVVGFWIILLFTK